jgi:hypothetical protein
MSDARISLSFRSIGLMDVGKWAHIASSAAGAECVGAVWVAPALRRFRVLLGDVPFRPPATRTPRKPYVTPAVVIATSRLPKVGSPRGVLARHGRDGRRRRRHRGQRSDLWRLRWWSRSLSVLTMSLEHSSGAMATGLRPAGGARLPSTGASPSYGGHSRERGMSAANSYRMRGGDEVGDRRVLATKAEEAVNVVTLVLSPHGSYNEQVQTQTRLRRGVHPVDEPRLTMTVRRHVGGSAPADRFSYRTSQVMK